MKDEHQYAIALANRVLDKPYIDPDGDICLLARQFLRAEERLSTVLKLAQTIAQEVGGKFADTHRLNTGLNKFIAQLESGEGEECT